MAKVYLTNNNFKNDYSSIPESLGTLVTITEGVTKKQPHVLYDLFRKAFENSSPEDYLVLSGPALLTAIAYHCWMERHPACQLFVWDSARGYILLQVE
jgi:hypothetical protein